MIKIITAPSKILSVPTQKVEFFDQKLHKIIKDMVRVMRHFSGIGIAANQIGLSLQIIAIECKTKDAKIPLTVILNPKTISKSQELNSKAEGCLSLPEIEVEVSRSNAIKIKGNNPKGKTITISAKGLFARIIQHELDHLQGILITDRGKILKNHDD